MLNYDHLVGGPMFLMWLQLREATLLGICCERPREAPYPPGTDRTTTATRWGERMEVLGAKEGQKVPVLNFVQIQTAARWLH
jgi:hypothetical protein